MAFSLLSKKMEVLRSPACGKYIISHSAPRQAWASLWLDFVLF